MTEQPPWPEANREISSMKHRIEDLESRLVNLETRIPDSNIISQSFWSRALAILGHQLAITLVIYAIIFVIALAFGLLAAVVSPR